MFNRVLLDLNYKELRNWEKNFDPREYKLIPFLYLIADEIIQTGDEFPSGDVVNEKRYGQHLTTIAGRPSFVKQVVALSQGRPNIGDMAEWDGIPYFSPIKTAKSEVLKRQGITMKNSVLLLAAAGLEITIPNLTFDLARSDEVAEIRDKLVEERQDYLHAIAEMADQTYQRVSEGVYSDTVDWAISEAFVKIKPKAENFQSKMKKLDKRLLRRLLIDFVTDGIPSIGSVTIHEGAKEGIRQTIVVLLETLCTNLARSIEERRNPEVVYGYKLSSHIKSIDV